MRTEITKLENTVLKVVAGHCFDEYSSSAIEVSKQTGINIETVKGVLGSLCKKGLLFAEQREVLFESVIDLKKDIFILLDGESVSFGCDYLYYDEYTQSINDSIIVKD